MVRMIALAAALLAGVFAVSTAAAQQFPPHRFFGSVTVNGQTAPNGTVVRATIGGTECATATVTGGSYVIDVPGVTINPNCGRSGSTVTFEVGDETASQTGAYRDGGYQQLNLTVGSGGGAQPSPTPAPSATPRPSATPAPTTQPSATPAPTARPSATPAPSAQPTTAPVATPRPQAPSGPAAVPAQRPAGAPAAAAPAAQRPAAAPAALPRTGTGLQGDTNLTAGWMLAGGALALFGVAGTAFVLRTSRRSRS